MAFKFSETGDAVYSTTFPGIVKRDSIFVLANDFGKVPITIPNWKPEPCFWDARFQPVAQSIKDLEVRPDDVWLAAYPKSGITWCQEMIWLVCNDLQYEKAATLNVDSRWCYLDLCTKKKHEGPLPMDFAPSPRFVKSHLPVALLPDQIWTVRPKMVYIKRNPKSVAVSCFHHYASIYGCTATKEQFMQAFLKDQVLSSPYHRHVIEYHHLDYPNMLHLCYEDMKRVLNPLDAVCNVPRPDAICVSNLRSAKKLDKAVLTERPDVKIFLPFRFYFYRVEELFTPNTYNKFLVAPGGDHLISLIDEISYVSPPSPMLSQIEDIPPEQFCNGDNRPPDCGPNCMCTHTVDIPLNAIVEVVLVDEVQQDNLSHPFHLHGHSFNVIGMGRSPDTTVKKINLRHALDLDRRGLLNRQFNLPPLKDTVAVPNNGYVVMRFRANNPGYWLFHCHFQFHIVIGMNLVVHVGSKADLPPVPPNFPRCGNHIPPIRFN